MVEKCATSSTINLYFDYNGRTLLHDIIEDSNEKDAKDRILKLLQMGADVTQEGTRWYENELAVESAVECRIGNWTS